MRDGSVMKSSVFSYIRVAFFSTILPLSFFLWLYIYFPAKNDKP